MKCKEGEFVYVDDDGVEWVRYEYFKSIDAIAFESKLIIEQIQMLLGVHTTTEALSRIVELKDGAGCACSNELAWQYSGGICRICNKPRR